MEDVPGWPASDGGHDLMSEPIFVLVQHNKADFIVGEVNRVQRGDTLYTLHRFREQAWIVKREGGRMLTTLPASWPVMRRKWNRLI